jgi:hypothetical protein
LPAAVIRFAAATASAKSEIFGFGNLPFAPFLAKARCFSIDVSPYSLTGTNSVFSNPVSLANQVNGLSPLPELRQPT